MAPRNESSHLKRARLSPEGDVEADTKKVRRSERLSQHPDGVDANASASNGLPPPAKTADQPTTPLQVPTPSFAQVGSTKLVATPPGGPLSQAVPSGSGNDSSSGGASYGSDLQDTQALPTQKIDPNLPLSDLVQDEVKEGVWGYLLPLNARYGAQPVVLKRRTGGLDDDATEAAAAGSSKKKGKKKSTKEDKSHLRGYLIGRHPECDVVVDDPIVSNRHCLIFAENKGNDTVAILEDLSSNGTFVNEALVGRNLRRELQEKDEIAVLDKARFVWRYPKSRSTTAFHQQYTQLDRLGKGHYAEVFLCVEKSTGKRFAVKVFAKTPGVDDKKRMEGLEQEIAVLMGVSHPNVLCLKDSFNETNAIYLVLELAPEGELFNYIVMHSRLSERDTHKLFKQLFEGIKYLHDRNIVHRDIKPENILLMDRHLTAKLADFGLAKIIGEDSFTTTLCGTPSYVAPEVLADNRHRKYTKAVDIWSLGVVLYICLCGFPPFSDELYSPRFPYTMSDQIRRGLYDYPSPHWDSVSDPPLDLIDHMLLVDPDERYTIDECMAHPWMRYAFSTDVADSTDGLVGGVADLAVDRHRQGATSANANSELARERTLLSAVNHVEITEVRRTAGGASGAVGTGGHPQEPIKIFSKSRPPAVLVQDKEPAPDDGGHVGGTNHAFMGLGERGDPVLFNDDSVLSSSDATDIAAQKKDKGKDNKER